MGEFHKKNSNNIKWQRSVFNPQKSLWPETSTSTLKLLLSPRPNLMPFPSRETASATKSILSTTLPVNIQSTFCQHFDGELNHTFNCTFILATNFVLRLNTFLTSF